MKVVELLAVVLLAVIVEGATELPNVKLTDCKAAGLSFFHKCLAIESKGVTEYAGLFRVDGFENILQGALFNADAEEKEGSRVSVSIKSKTGALVMIHDPEDGELYQLRVNLGSGVSQEDTLPHDGQFHLNDEKGIQDRIDPLKRILHLQNFLKSREGMPFAYREVFKLRVQMVAEANFQNKYGKAETEERVAGVVNHMKTFYAHSSLRFSFDLDKLPIQFLDEKILITEDNLDHFMDIVNEKTASGDWPDADTYILLGTKNKGGLYGIANPGWDYGSGVCAKVKGNRASINWYEVDTNHDDGIQDDDLLTALTVVHETGHNLGMMHDFTSNWRGGKKDRYDESGESCTYISAFMDYVFPPYTSYNPMPNKWSRCSWEDFIYAYQQVLDYDGDYCLAKESDDITGCKNVMPAYMVDGAYIRFGVDFTTGDTYDWDAGCEASKQKSNACATPWFAMHCKKTCGLC